MIEVVMLRWWWSDRLSLFGSQFGFGFLVERWLLGQHLRSEHERKKKKKINYKNVLQSDHLDLRFYQKYDN